MRSSVHQYFNVKMMMCVFLLHVNGLNAQKPGLYFSQESIWNTSGHTFNGYMARKSFLGLNITNKKENFAVAVSFGIKGYKMQISHPSFASEFKEEFLKVYHPVNQFSTDSVIGASIYETTSGMADSYHLGGTYSYHVKISATYKAIRLNPSISYSVYNEVFTLYSHVIGSIPGFSVSDDDDYIDLGSLAHEIKFGFNLLPFKTMDDLPFRITGQVGYKWIDYQSLSFTQIAFSSFTNDTFVDKFSKERKAVFGITFIYVYE